MADELEISESLRSRIAEIGGRVTSDIDLYTQYRSIENETERLRTILQEWSGQQKQDRKLRERYAMWLMVVMSVQVVAITTIFVLIGCGILTFEPWTAKTFIMAVFAEIASMTFLVVKYLFTTSSERILDLIDRDKQES